MTGAAPAAEAWQGETGRKWRAEAAGLDRLLAPVLDALLDAASPAPGERALDIGCGAGATSLALARAVGPEGRVLGADISPALLAHAEARGREAGLGHAAFALADAETHPFPPAGFDLALSRFGVMFFADTAAAFANIARALRPGGRIALAVWTELEANPWFTLPRDAALARLPAPAPRPAEAPGPFALADLGRLAGLLAAGGFAEVSVRPVDLALTPPGPMAEAARLATALGPAARIVSEAGAGPAVVAEIEAAVAAAFAPVARRDALRLPARIALATARRP